MDVPSPPIITQFPQNPKFRHPPPGDTSALLQPFPHPYHITQRPNSNPPPKPATAVPMPTSKHREPPSPKPAHLPANTTQTAAKTPLSAPIQPHDPLNALLELAEMRGNEREIESTFPSFHHVITSGCA